MKAEDDPGFLASFVIGDFLLVVGFAEESEGGAIHSGTGLNNVRNEFLSGFFVKIFERLATGFLVLLEIVIGTVRDAFEFLGAEREGIEKVVCTLGVEGSVFFRDIEDGDFTAGDADRFVPGKAVGEPLIEPFFSICGGNKKFDLHLFELAGSEGEVPRVDFVTESFPYLGDSEGQFFSRDFENIFELDEHGLGRFGPKVGEISFVLDGADVGFEHEVELPGFGEFTAAGIDHFAGFLGAGSGGDLIGTEAAFASFAIDHGIGEGGFVATSLPDGATHQDGAVHADDIVALLGHGFPPVVFQVPFESDSQGPVVPCAVQSSVDLGGWEDKAPAFAESHDFFHSVIRHRAIFGF